MCCKNYNLAVFTIYGPQNLISGKLSRPGYAQMTLHIVRNANTNTVKTRSYRRCFDQFRRRGCVEHSDMSRLDWSFVFLCWKPVWSIAFIELNTALKLCFRRWSPHIVLDISRDLVDPTHIDFFYTCGWGLVPTIYLSTQTSNRPLWYDFPFFPLFHPHPRSLLGTHFIKFLIYLFTIPAFFMERFFQIGDGGVALTLPTILPPPPTPHPANIWRKKTLCLWGKADMRYVRYVLISEYWLNWEKIKVCA